MQHTTVQSEETLRKHLELCESCYTLLQEENSFLKHEKKPTSPALLEKKKALLESLEISNRKLKQINEQNTPLPPKQKCLAQDAQKKIMKIFLIDRENEQLLLKYSFNQSIPSPAQTPPAATVNQIRDTYK